MTIGYADLVTNQLKNSLYERKPVCGCCYLMHWSYFPLVIIAVASAALAVIAFIFSQIPLGITGAILLVTASVSAYYIRKFSLTLFVQEERKKLNALSDKFNEQLAKLNDENHSLKILISTLRSQQAKAIEIIKKREALLEEKESILESYQKTISNLKGKIETLADVASSFHKSTEEMSKEVLNLGEGVSGLEREVREVADNVVELDKVQETVEDHVETLDQQIDKLELLSNNFEKMLTRWQELFLLMGKLFSQREKNILELKETLGKAQKNLPEITKERENLESVLKRVEQLIREKESK